MELIVWQRLVDNTACYLLALGAVNDITNLQDMTYYTNFYLNYFKKYDKSKHEGDCTQQPFTCSQCLIDDYRDRALSLLNKEVFDKYLTDQELI